jgi:rhamnulokinase
MNPVPHNGDSKLAGSASHPARTQRDTTPSLVAVDLGAESCRVSLLRWINGQPEIHLVHRFPNGPISEQDTLRWEIRRICDGVEEGLRRCAELTPEGIAAIGVDGWAVDYVRLDAEGNPTANPFCYRDQRNVAAQKEVHARISAEQLYRLTGIQIVTINTLYQLYADGLQGVGQSTPWVTLPEFVLYQLGGKRVAEYTNATHTQMLGINSRAWCEEVFAATGLDLKAAPPLVRPGTDIGRVEGRVARSPAFRDTRLIVPACHDTASAIAGISAQGEDWAFISSGTWSLVGCVRDSPCLSEDAVRSNFSNEGGIGGKINFLKIVNGLWPLQQCMQHWQSEDRAWALDDLLHECALLPQPSALLDVDDPALLLPGNMPARINTQLERAGHAPILEEPAMVNLILHSLATRYATVVRDLAKVTGRRFKRIFVVGGGNRNRLLNRLTGEATGLEVVAGPTESATVGNFAIQLAALAGDYKSDTGVTATAVAKWAGRLAAGAAASAEIESVLSR